MKPAHETLHVSRRKTTPAQTAHYELLREHVEAHFASGTEKSLRVDCTEFPQHSAGPHSGGFVRLSTAAVDRFIAEARAAGWGAARYNDELHVRLMPVEGERWEIMVVPAPAAYEQRLLVAPSWEPFAASDGNIFLRRRPPVQLDLALPYTPGSSDPPGDPG